MTSAITEQVLAANRRFYEAVEALDVAAMEACWSSSDEAACVHPGGPWLRGWDEIGGAWEAIMANTGYIEFEIADAQVIVNDPVAWVTCVERITTSATQGGAAGAEVAATNMFVLEATGWRMVLHHASPIIRPAPMEEE